MSGTAAPGTHHGNGPVGGDGTVGPRRDAGPLAGWLDSPIVERIDEIGERWADTLRGRPWADRLFYGLSTAGDHGGVWHAIAVLQALTGRASWRDGVEFSSAIGVEAAVLNGPVKLLFRRSRPVVEGERPLHLRTPRTSSFPSGHASSGMFAATLLAARGGRSWPWYLLGATIGWSRVHVRIHHPSDVVGGLVAGILLGRIGASATDSLRRRTGRPPWTDQGPVGPTRR
ncbi:MAG: phosphatase PAP2 family protein [Microthrixaceae bacterium]